MTDNNHLIILPFATLFTFLGSFSQVLCYLPLFTLHVSRHSLASVPFAQRMTWERRDERWRDGAGRDTLSGPCRYRSLPTPLLTSSLCPAVPYSHNRSIVSLSTWQEPRRSSRYSPTHLVPSCRSLPFLSLLTHLSPRHSVSRPRGGNEGGT